MLFKEYVRFLHHKVILSTTLESPTFSLYFKKVTINPEVKYLMEIADERKVRLR